MIKKIRVNLQKYSVKYQGFGALADNFGMTKFQDNSIHIDNSVVKSVQELTLAHEILHVLLNESGLNHKLCEIEEEIVRSLEGTFYSFLKENTNFFT